MTIRIIVRTDNAQMAVNVGGAVYTYFRTFDVELPEIEAALDSGGRHEDGSFEHTQVVGVEVLRKEVS
jgi:hypothetical protein